MMADIRPDTETSTQNHPNPFNPTTVRLGLPDAAKRITLSVHDMLGRREAILPVLLTLLTSCATVGPAREYTPEAYPERTEPNATHTPADDATSDHLDGLTPVQRRLNAAYRDWNGTPYLYGGVNRIGVDCSAFTRIVYREYLQADLPRTTREQLASGRRIGRRHLEPGDLVFFRTARRTLHVGVMLDERWFLHASTSEGVTVSSLQSPYWASVYIGARRMVGTPDTTTSTPQSGRNLIGGTRPS